MFRRASAFTFLLCILPVILDAQTPTPWAKTRVGQTPVTALIPGVFRESKKDTSSAATDWVSSAQDYSFDSDDYFVQATVFEAKAGTKIDRDFLKQVATDISKGMEDGKEKPLVESQVYDGGATFDKLTTVLKVKNGDSSFRVENILFGVSDKVYSVAVVSFPDIKGSTELGHKIAGSVKFEPLP